MNQISNEEIALAVKNNTSYSDVIRTLGRVPAGGSFRWIKNLIRTMNLDTSHFMSVGETIKLRHQNGHYPQVSKRLTDEELFTQQSASYTSKHIKQRLLETGMLYCCKACGISTWNEKPLSLQLDHINGINSDNRKENLQLLCPNCHSQTPTFCGRNSKKERTPAFCECGKEIAKSSKRCGVCASSRTKANYPPPEELLTLCKEHGFCEMGRRLGVSDNAIRRYLARRGY